MEIKKLMDMSQLTPFSVAHFVRSDELTFEQLLLNHILYIEGKLPKNALGRDWYHASAHAVRDYLVEKMSLTIEQNEGRDQKQVCYLSLEFLIGRSLSNAALNLKVQGPLRDGLKALGQDLEHIESFEADAALGNGGLGRLAACFLDSMATLNMPGIGYGIRYEYGMFRQNIEQGQQREHPDNWLRYGNPWEFQRPELVYRVKFKGHVVDVSLGQGHTGHHWVDGETVMAMAYDVPIPGYATNTVNTLRLWGAKAPREFDLDSFNEGDYIGAVHEKEILESLSKVLYPNDNSTIGRELRLKQEYFFVSASLQDILQSFIASHNDLSLLPDKVAVQLNDTHPAIAVAELMYQLVDRHHLRWNRAWQITTKVFSYTNHTLMPEALETWPVDMMERMLPRHLQIIYRINQEFLELVNHQFPGDPDLLSRVSIIDEGNGRRVRMAYLAIIGSHTVNGVAALHSELLKTTLFADFHRIYPKKFTNVTNGITPRRWLGLANPTLTELIASRIGDDFLHDLSQLRKLEPLSEEVEFRQQFQAVKQANKVHLAEVIHKHLDIIIDPHSLFDVQIKRIHEYKRQLLNILHVITLYNRIRLGQVEGFVPRTVIFAGKAAPGYKTAKLIIRLINDVAHIVNHDPKVGMLLKVVFYPNYDVSAAEIIVPACDLSEQISTAGTEASGTGNMKMALNGALTIGTLDGANIEIGEEVGAENIFIFGLTTSQVADLRAQGYNPKVPYDNNAELREVIAMIRQGFFSVTEHDRYHGLCDSLTEYGDHYMVLADYASFCAKQEQVSALYRDQEEWTRRAILNVARMGKFSSDRTIREYADLIWKINYSEGKVN